VIPSETAKYAAPNSRWTANPVLGLTDTRCCGCGPEGNRTPDLLTARRKDDRRSESTSVVFEFRPDSADGRLVRQKSTEVHRIRCQNGSALLLTDRGTRSEMAARIRCVPLSAAICHGLSPALLYGIALEATRPQTV